MKKQILVSALLTHIFFGAQAQNSSKDSTLEVAPLRETVVSANRSSQARRAVAQQVDILTKAEIQMLNAQTSADLLQNAGSVFLQKSQQGGGSPVLRGFEASRVLLVVDGVRMNNAIYRAGHLQNVITLDNAALERAEVLYGPASTLYGTDALGGAVCFFTKDPQLAAPGQRLRSTGSAFVRYGSANQEKTAHADLSLGGRRWGSFSSLTFSDFGDLRMGAREGSAPFFGRRDFYVQRIGGKDSLLRNADPLVQKFSGYRQYDALQKVVFQQNSNIRHLLNLQFSTTFDVPRYDRLTDPGNNGSGLAVAEWYYGPQKRLLAAYTLSLQRAGWFSEGLQATLSYQDIEESRNTRNFGAPNRTTRVERLDVWGLTLSARRSWAAHNLQIGLDGQHNAVDSKASALNLNTGTRSPRSTRYPDGGSSMYNLALFATHSCGRDRWVLSDGLRVGFSNLRATFVDKTFFPFPFDETAQRNTVAAGNLGAVWNGPNGWRVALNAASGFRVPNVDDLGKVFDSAPGDVVVPNPDIRPEKTFNLDLNLSKQITGRLRWEGVLWATAMRDAIVTDVFRFAGQDSIDFDGTRSRVLASQNTQNARLYGISSNLEVELMDHLDLYGSIAFTKGQILRDEGDKSPLGHIPPLYGRAGARWHTGRYHLEAFVLFNGKKRIQDYQLEGEDNEQYAPPDGMPAWLTLNLRSGLRFSSHFSLQAGVDNLLDIQYRTFSSGINGPGRNLFLTVRTAF